MPKVCPTCGDTGEDPNPLNDPGPCPTCHGFYAEPGTCEECGAAPVNAQGFCATCEDERRFAAMI